MMKHMGEKHMEEKKKGYKKAGVSLGTVAGVAIVATLLILTGPTPRIVNEDGVWQVVWEGNLASAAENDPGAGASGFLQIFFINHTAAPATAYDENTSATLETWCTANMPGKTPYASADEFNVEIDHSTTFDILVRVRFNQTHAHNGTAFVDSDTRVNITCSGDLSIADATGTNVVSHNTSGGTFIWINVYWNNGGAGYSINKDETFDVDEISIEAKF